MAPQGCMVSLEAEQLGTLLRQQLALSWPQAAAAMSGFRVACLEPELARSETIWAARWQAIPAWLDPITGSERCKAVLLCMLWPEQQVARRPFFHWPPRLLTAWLSPALRQAAGLVQAVVLCHVRSATVHEHCTSQPVACALQQRPMLLIGAGSHTNH